MFMRLLTASVTVVLLAAGSTSAQMFTDFKPGGTVPKDGYTPDPQKVMYVVFWHHKKLTNEFDHRAYYMNADGVNNTTADKMKKMMEDRFPNLTVYVKETNERDIKTVIEREQNRVKFIEKDWVDLKQPEKVETPTKLSDARGYGYDDTIKKAPSALKLENTTWICSEDGKQPKYDEEVAFLPKGKVVFRNTAGGEKNGEWSQDGDNLQIKLQANSVLTYSGTVQRDQFKLKGSTSAFDGAKQVEFSWDNTLRFKK